MDTTRTGTRTILATAAAGALVLGSAGIAAAHPGAGKGPKDGYVKITKVDIRKHKKINLDDAYGDLKIRVKVRDTDMTEGADGAVTGLSVALFTSKRAANAMVPDSEIAAASDGAVERGKKKKWITYKFTVDKAALESLDEMVTAPFKGYLCISDVETTIDQVSRQTAQRLDDVESKKTLRECVKVFDRADA